MILSAATAPRYIGRFAPSPTGPLHLGSLYTALASFLDARQHQGLWLLRIDDLDKPRNAPGAADAIQHCLERFGLHWDGTVFFESRHRRDYHAHLHQLLQHQQLYACRCSRKQLEGHAVYPGFCRKQNWQITADTTLRVKTCEQTLSFHDRLQGLIENHLGSEHGDFIVRRRDRIIAYQLAVVVNDHLQAVNHVVRGIDLLPSTIKQLYLYQQLNYPPPIYMHVPVIVDATGAKLSKQTLAAPVDTQKPETTVFTLLQLLGQNPAPDLRGAPVAEQLAWGVAHWHPDALLDHKTLPTPAALAVTNDRGNLSTTALPR